MCGRWHIRLGSLTAAWQDTWTTGYSYCSCQHQQERKLIIQATRQEQRRLAMEPTFQVALTYGGIKWAGMAKGAWNPPGVR